MAIDSKLNTNNVDPFSNSIAGQSLTRELGSAPWEQPPLMDSPEEVLNYYIDKLTTGDAMDDIFVMAEIGVPIDVISETITLKGVGKGLHNLDVAYLVQPDISTFIKAQAQEANIKYVPSFKSIANSIKAKDTQNKERMATLLRTQLNNTTSEDIINDEGIDLMEDIEQSLLKNPRATKMEETEQVEDTSIKKPNGLMQRSMI